MHWRRIQTLSDDPFVQKGPDDRMARLLELGIGLVGAVPFSFREESRGIVLFFSRTGADMGRLRSASNERYMMASADVIGAIHSVGRAREEAVEGRRNRYREAVRKARKEVLREKQCMGSIVLNKFYMAKLREQRASEQDLHQVEQNALGTDTFVKELVERANKLGERMRRR